MPCSHPPEQALEILEDIELEAQDLRETLARDGLLAALDLLTKALGNNEENLSKVLGSTEALNAALVLTGGDAEETRAIFAALAEAGIAEVDAAFLAASETAEHRWRTALVDIEAQAIRIAEHALPVMAGGLELVADNLGLVVGAGAALIGLKLGAA